MYKEKGQNIAVLYLYFKKGIFELSKSVQVYQSEGDHKTIAI